MFLIIIDKLFPEVFGELLSEISVQVFACCGEFLRARNHERIIGDVYYSLKGRHLLGVYLLCHHIADKQESRLRMVHNVVYLVCGEFMENRYCHCSIRERSEKCYGPVAHITPAEGYLVAPVNVAVLKENMEFLNLACNVLILKRSAFIVCQGI